MGCTAALKMRRVAANVERILAIELMSAAQGIDFRREALGHGARLGRGTSPVYEILRRKIPFVERDTLMYPLIEAAHRAIVEDEVIAAVSRALATGEGDVGF